MHAGDFQRILLLLLSHDVARWLISTWIIAYLKPEDVASWFSAPRPNKTAS